MRPGQRLGGYELVRELGRGAMGVVFLARQVSLDRPVALKLMQSFEALGSLQRFEREGQLAGRLIHPNIVRVHETGAVGNLRFLCMEYVEGESLAQRLRRGPLAPDEAVRIVRTLADAVAYAHSQDVLHRDLKPENVLIDAHDQPRITDFGVGRLLAAADQQRLTATGEVIGTPDFMPPEQISDARGVDGRADVYALGATLYALLTGEPPFVGASKFNVLNAVLTKPAPALPAHLGPELAAICARCLEKDPEQRYPSAQALADALERPRGEAPKAVGSRALLGIASAVIGVALLVFAGVLYTSGGAQERPPVRPPPVDPPEEPPAQVDPVVEEPPAPSGPSWHAVELQSAPPLRWGARMVYSERKQRVYLFGGRDSERCLDDLWTFEGRRWRRLEHPEGAIWPPARSHHGLALEPRRARLVLYGGVRPLRNHWQALADSWTWTEDDGWSQNLGGSQPYIRGYHLLANDLGLGQVVLVGGDRLVSSAAERLGDVWALDANDTWRRIDARGGPGPLAQAAGAADIMHGGLLIFGGCREGNVPLATLWRLDHRGWRPLSEEGPPARRRASLVHTQQGALLFGGKGEEDQLLQDVWLWKDGWTRLSDLPAGLCDAASAYDALRDVVVVFGGRASDAPDEGSARTYELRW